MALFNKKSNKIQIAGVEISIFTLSVKKMLELQTLQEGLTKGDLEAVNSLFGLIHGEIDQTVQAVSLEDLQELNVADFTILIKAISGDVRANM